MSLTGSCFSSESAPRPFHYGIRRRGGTILWAALPSVERQVQADIRTHLIHRPARDIIPPLGGARVFLLSRLILHGPYAASLIGSLGSSAFGLSTTIAVSMSLAGSCISSGSAPRPFPHFIPRPGRTILLAALSSVDWQDQTNIRSFLFHLPA